MISRRAALLAVGVGAPILTVLLAAASANWLDDPGARASLVIAGGWFSALLGIIYSALAWSRPQDRVYLWFALAAWMWSARFVLPALLVDVTPTTMRLLIGLLQTLFVATAFMLAVRLIEYESRYFERGLAVMVTGAVLGLSAATWLMPEHVGEVDEAIHFTMRAVGLWVAFLVGRALLRRMTVELVALMFSGVVIMLISMESLWSYLFDTAYEPGRYQALATPLFGLTLAAMLLTRFITALRSVEAANARLERAVRQTRDRLEAEHRQVERLVAESATQAERERIMRDVHDGVGGHLVAALTLLGARHGGPFDDGSSMVPSGAQRGRLRERLEAALLDLRLVIDSLEDVDGDVGSILGMLRARMRPVLDAAGICGEWRMSDLPDHLTLGHGEALDLMRIVQETFTNAIRHAHAKRIDVRAQGGNDGSITVTVDDDGQGFDGAPMGRGLGNMRRRAQRLGARLDVSSSHEGTRIALTLVPPLGPLEPN